MAEKREPKNCSVRDGRFVVPCSTLEDQVEQSLSTKGRGVTRFEYTNLETLVPSRTMFGVRTKESPDGFLFNFCPFCGERIDMPFLETPNE